MFRKIIGFLSLGVFAVLKTLFVGLFAVALACITFVFFIITVAFAITTPLAVYLMECQAEYLASIKENKNGS